MQERRKSTAPFGRQLTVSAEVQSATAEGQRGAQGIRGGEVKVQRDVSVHLTENLYEKRNKSSEKS